MRQILFRGYNRKNNKWLYGYYLVNRGQHFICPDGIQNPLASWEDFVVEEESVGQWTGFKDKNGRQIYEGDIVIYRDNSYNNGIAQSVVEYELAEFAPIFCLSLSSFVDNGMIEDCNIIGNIYENKELLEDEE